MAKETFYSAYGQYTDKLEPGFKLKIEHHIEYESYRIDRPEIAAQVKFSPAELKQKRKASAKLEQKVYNKMLGTVKEWEAQAAQTLLLDKALEYANIPTVAHTSNAAQKYIQGRFDLYVGLFRDLRPPIPDEFKRHFYINGCLLPEYTVVPPEMTKPDEKVVESLLDFLDEDDTAPPPPVTTDNPTPQSPAKAQRPAAPPSGERPKRPPAKPKPKRKNTMSR